MCLIVFAYNMHPKYRLIIAANRDEFLNRATARLHKWKNPQGIIGGRDLQAGGTWMAVDPKARFAALTNVRNPTSLKPNAESRGNLIPSYLLSGKTPMEYLKTLQNNSKRYNGFNILVGDKNDILFFSTTDRQIIPIQPGIHGISNHTLNTPWVKVKKIKGAMQHLLKSSQGKSGPMEPSPSMGGEKQFLPDESQRDIIDSNGARIKKTLFRIMQDREPAQDADLPDTGVGYALEKNLSPVFISMPGYATRSTSVILMDRNRHVDFSEITWSAHDNYSVEILI